MLVLGAFGLAFCIAMIAFAFSVFVAWEPVSPSYWDQNERFAFGALVLLAAIGGLFILVALVRQSVLGYPRAYIEGNGLRVGSVLLRWNEIQSIAPAAPYGEPFLAIDVPPSTIESWSLFDRAVARLNVSSGFFRVMLSEQQLGLTMDAVLRELRAMSIPITAKEWRRR